MQYFIRRLGRIKLKMDGVIREFINYDVSIKI